MEIIDLEDRYEKTYLCCLEDWSEEMRDAGDRKKTWYDGMKEKGLRVKLAVDDGSACGMIQYTPAEWSPLEGKGFHFINCIWVHGHRQGIGNRQKKGVGTMLLNAAEEDARSAGSCGMAAWGLALPFWMKASWFRKHGYRKVDRVGITVLMWKPFGEEAAPPRWIREKQKPGCGSGRVCVTSFNSGWCQALNITAERARRAAAGFGDAVEFREVNTSSREALLEWGISDGLFIDGKRAGFGPPPSVGKLRGMIARRVGRQRSCGCPKSEGRPTREDG